MKKSNRQEVGIVAALRILPFLIISGVTCINVACASAASAQDGIIEQFFPSPDGRLIGQASGDRAEYAPGQLIVKLKDGQSMDALAALNAKYNVASFEKLLQGIDTPEQILKQLKDKLANLDQGHEQWYWQMDKDSPEYKQYMAKLEKEKQAVQVQINAQEKVLAHIAQRQLRAPEGSSVTSMENYFVVKVPVETDILAMAKEYSAHPAVASAQPDSLYKTSFIPNDPSFGEQWSHRNTVAASAWDINRGNPYAVIAIIDTGVDYTHEDLQGNIWHDYAGNPGRDLVDLSESEQQALWQYGYEKVPGEDYTVEDGDPADINGHGTHCAGIAAGKGNNGIGISGACPDCSIMPARAGFSIYVKNADGTRTNAGLFFHSTIARAIEYAANNGADVLSMSFGGSTANSAIGDALQRAYFNGVVLVAAAGNTGTTDPHYPAAYGGVISVASTGPDDRKANFSTYGDWVTVAAPGGGSIRGDRTNYILSTYLGNQYAYMRGTSMAAPYVAGVAGLALSAGVPDVQKALRLGVDPIEDWGVGFGRINVQKVVTFKPSNPFLRLVGWERHVVPGTGSDDDLLDNYLNPGETWDHVARMTNYGGVAKDVTITVTSPEAYVQVLTPTLSPGTIGTDETKDVTVRLKIADNAPTGIRTRLQYEITSGSWYQSQILAIGFVTPFPVNPVKNKNNWPVRLKSMENWGHWDPYMPNSDWTGRLPSPPLVADLDGDGKDEVVTYDMVGRSITVRRGDGTIMPGWPLNLLSFLMDWVAAPPVAGDIDGDKKQEIVFVARHAGTTWHWSLYALRLDGSVVPGWPKEIIGRSDSSEATMVNFARPVLADLNKDGKLEVILFYYGDKSSSEGNNPRDPTSSGGVCEVFNGDGSLLPGWPKNTYVLYDPTGGTVFNYRYGLLAPPVTADLDGDGDLEVAVFAPGGANFWGKGYKIMAWHHDGKPVNGWPVGFKERVAQMVSGDIDQDGADELVLCLFDETNNPNGDWTALASSRISVLRGNGTVANGWSLTPAPTIASTSRTLFYGPSGIAVADIAGDKHLEIIANILSKPGSSTVPVSYLYVYHDDGTVVTGWPKEIKGNTTYDVNFINRFANTPIVADINADGKPEILLPTMYSVESFAKGYWDSRLLGWDAAGNVLSEFPKETREFELLNPVFGDIDGDKKIDMILPALSEFFIDVSTGMLDTELDGKVIAMGFEGAVDSIQWGGLGFDATGNGRYTARAATSPVPAAPSNLGAQVVSAAQINLSWMDNANNEQGFKIERRMEQDTVFTPVGEVGENVTCYEDTGLAADTVYEYRVKAFNTAGDSAYSNTITAKTEADESVSGKPLAPSELSVAYITTSQITLRWKDNSTNEEGFKIERKTADGSTFLQIALVGANTVTFMDSKLRANTTYQYRLKASNAAGDSALSNVISVTTPRGLKPRPPVAAKPIAPSGLKIASGTATEVELSWLDNSRDEQGFAIECSVVSSTSGFEEIARVARDQQSFVDPSMLIAKVRFYRVRAYNDAGYSDYSNTVGTFSFSR